jgi:hypothetical protein
MAARPLFLMSLATTLAWAGCKSGEDKPTPEAIAASAAASGASGPGVVGTSPARVPAAKPPAPSDLAGARAALEAFLAPDADRVALTAKLRPAPADYAAVFKAPLAEQAAALYDAAWGAGVISVAPKAEHDTVRVAAATTEQLVAWGPEAQAFPGAWKGLAHLLQPGVTWYRFKFTRADSELGMAFDGLARVDGHWRIFPKPQRALTPDPGP